MTPKPPPSTLQEVEQYLQDFKTKLSVFSVFFLDRDQNSTKTLLKLGLSGTNRLACLQDLEPTDYVAGPEPSWPPAEASRWVFGRTIRHCEVYIEVTLGHPDSSLLCVSFHLVEHPMRYPLKFSTPPLGPTS